MDPALNRGCRMIQALFGVLIISLILQVVGYATPGWFVMDIQQNEIKISMGLYYMVICISGQCRSHRYGQLLQGQRDAYEQFIDWMGEYRTMASIALVATVFSCILTGVYMCQSRVERYPANYRIKLILTSLAGLLAGSLAIAAAGKMGQQISDAKRLLDVYNSDVMNFSFPYSLLLTGAGGFLILCTSFVQIGYLISDRNSQNSANSQGMIIQQNGGVAVPPQNLNVYTLQYGQGMVGQSYLGGPPAYSGTDMPMSDKQMNF